MHWIVNFDNGKSPCRVNQAASAVGKYIYSFGGYCQQSTVNDLKFYNPIDVYALNSLTFRWRRRARPQVKDHQYLLTPYFRYGHTCVTYNERIYLWGGRADWTNSLCNTLFAYNPKAHTWKKVAAEGERPDGRDGHTASVVESQGTMLIFGGYVQKSSLRPHWRDFHTATTIDDKMYIFGGRMDKGHELFTGESFYSNDLHMFDTSKKVWLELKPDSSNHVMPLADSAEEKLKRFSPCGRRSHSAVAYRRKIIIFGGFQENAQKHFNDLYEFDVDKCAWKSCSFKGKSPSPRRRHSCCIIDDRMFLFGGTGPSVSPITAASSANTQRNNNQLSLLPNAANTSLQSNSDAQVLFQGIQNLNIQNMQQLELNLNQISNALRDRNDLNIDILNRVVGVALSALSRPRFESAPQIIENQENINQRNDNNNNLVNLMYQEPQVEYQDNNHEFNESFDRMVIDELNPGNDTDLEPIVDPHNLNYIVEELDEFENEEEFIDSGDEDLIDEDSDEEGDEDINTGLISLSDLHILDLEVSSLRYLSMLQIIDSNICYNNLPMNLM